MQSQRDAIVRLSGERKKISEEAEQARVASEKREEEYVQRIARLEEFGEKKVVECKAAELLTEEISADCKWLLSRAVPLVTSLVLYLPPVCVNYFSHFALCLSQIADRIVNSPELATYMFELS
ncbi:hypothetical protein HanHA89_Chr05g0209881 [Helianthus annuus]|nr:hypothetical protein HanHA89_Chr05g0209881 [Helianthus annuus]